MNPYLAATGPVAIDLNGPGRYLNWSIFTISVANLVLIGVLQSIHARGELGRAGPS